VRQECPNSSISVTASCDTRTARAPMHTCRGIWQTQNRISTHSWNCLARRARKSEGKEGNQSWGQWGGGVRKFANGIRVVTGSGRAGEIGARCSGKKRGYQVHNESGAEGLCCCPAPSPGLPTGASVTSKVLDLFPRMTDIALPCLLYLTDTPPCTSPIPMKTTRNNR